MLLELGIDTLPQLAGTDPAWLAEALAVHGEQHREMAAQLVAQARVQAAGDPEHLPQEPALVRGGPLPELAAAPGVLLYDIESDPDARDDFLHGFVLVRRGPDGSWPDAVAEQMAAWRYVPLLARIEHGEQRLWQRLQALLGRYPDWPLLHYGETEAIALVRLAKRMGSSDAELAALRRRLVDVHARLRQHWRLPVNSYGLKAVASWRGFRWSQSGVDGARCLLWWRQWRRDPQLGRRHLGRIFTYNRDDNLATWAVVCWLLDQARVGGATNAGGVEIDRDALPSASRVD